MVLRAAAARYHIWGKRPSSGCSGRYLGRVPGAATETVFPWSKRPQNRPKSEKPSTRGGKGQPATSRTQPAGSTRDHPQGPGGRPAPLQRPALGVLKPHAEEHHVQRARHEQCKGQCHLHPIANGFENRLHRLNDGKSPAKSPEVYFRGKPGRIQVSFTSRFLFPSAKRRPKAPCRILQGGFSLEFNRTSLLDASATEVGTACVLRALRRCQWRDWPKNPTGDHEAPIFRRLPRNSRLN